MPDFQEDIIRVKDTYYQVYKRPFRETMRTELGVRKKAELKEDGIHLTSVPKYVDFVILPDYIHHRQVWKGLYYNLFTPFQHKFTKGKWETIDMLLKHIFGDQYEMGLDYMYLLLMEPAEILPILVLVSEERKTGKTTFLNLLRDMFGSNYVKIDPSALGSSFNSSWATKNIIAIDETVIDKQQSIEKLKDISTSDDVLVNGKFETHYTVPFYGKIIMNSNSEDRFIRIDSKEIRFWIRKCPIISKEMVDIGKIMLKEIPAFAHYLRNEHVLKYPEQKSRHWFPTEALNTKALDQVKEESRSELHKDLLMRIDEWCENNPKEKHMKFSVSDIKEAWYKNNNNWNRPYISRVLKNEMEMEPVHERYIPFNEHKGVTSKVGRIFVVDNAYYEGDIPF